MTLKNCSPILLLLFISISSIIFAMESYDEVKNPKALALARRHSIDDKSPLSAALQFTNKQFHQSPTQLVNECSRQENRVYPLATYFRNKQVDIKIAERVIKAQNSGLIVQALCNIYEISSEENHTQGQRQEKVLLHQVNLTELRDALDKTDPKHCFHRVTHYLDYENPEDMIDQKELEQFFKNPKNCEHFYNNNTGYFNNRALSNLSWYQYRFKTALGLATLAACTAGVYARPFLEELANISKVKFEAIFEILKK